MIDSTDALKWLEMGIAVIPVRYMSKKPALSHWEPYQTRLPIPLEIASWFIPRRNIGIVVGWTGLVVIDFDTLDAYLTWQLWAARANKFTNYVSQTTYQVKTARGVHVYIRLPYPEQNRKLPGIDIQAQRRYVLGAGSIHPSGTEYKAMNSIQIIMLEALSDILPTSLLTHNTEYAGNVTLKVKPIIDSNDPWVIADRVLDPSQDIIWQIRHKHSVLDFFSDAVPSSGDGRWYMAKCPFHDDVHPSFWIDAGRGICGCYAGCTPKPLDVINLYARLHGVSNREAILLMAKGAA